MAHVHAIEPKTFSSPDENETPSSRSFPVASTLTELSHLQRQEYRFIIQQKKQFILRKKGMKEALFRWYRKGAYLGRCNIFVKVVLSPPNKHDK